MADLQFACNGPKFITLYRNSVGRAFDAVIMYIGARLYPGISKYVLQNRFSYSSIGSSLFVLLGRSSLNGYERLLNACMLLLHAWLENLSCLLVINFN